MDILLRDLRYAFRTLIRNPVFSVVVILTLGVAIGVNSAAFSLVNATLLRPLPYKDADGIMMVWGQNLRNGYQQTPLSVPDFNDYRDQNQVFDQLTAYTTEDFNIIRDGVPERRKGSFVEAHFFSVLGSGALLGRTFLPEDGLSNSERAIVLSYDLWQRSFGGDRNIVGKKLLINTAPFTVIGVTPANFKAPDKNDEMWAPINFDGGDRLRIPSVTSFENLTQRRFRYLTAMGRLKSGVTHAQAQEDLNNITAQLQRLYPGTNAQFNIKVTPIKEQVLGNIRPMLWILLLAGSFILLIACANVASLLISRSMARQKEIAVRIAMGSSRRQLIRQFMTESLVISMVSLPLGLLLSYLPIKLLLALNPTSIPRLNELTIDYRVLGFTFVISLLTGLIFGLVPAIQASKPNLNEILKIGARGGTGGKRSQTIRKFILISEVALAQILLINAGLMIKSFWVLQKVSPGFTTQNILTVQIAPSQVKYGDDAKKREFYRQVLGEIRQLPGVESVGMISPLPLGGDFIALHFEVEGHPVESPSDRPLAQYTPINEDYFNSANIPLLDGRYFTESDNHLVRPVLMVNQNLAKQYWPNESAIGKRIIFRPIGKSDKIAGEIVGVVGEVKHTSLEQAAEASLYVPYLQHPWGVSALVVRSTSNPLAMTNAVRQAVLRVDKDQPVFDVKTMDQVVSDSIAQPKVNTILIGLLSALALAQAAIGVYGVMSYSVVQRRQEIGIRLALGAPRGNIFKLIIGQGMLLTLIGIGVGLAIALALSRLVASLLYGVSTTDLLTFIAAPTFLVLIALFSSYLPALRATRVNPLTALHYE